MELFNDTSEEAIDLIVIWLDPLVEHALKRRGGTSAASSTSGDSIFSGLSRLANKRVRLSN